MEVPECHRRDAETKDLKQQIIALVQLLHEAEKEDANMQYVGKSN
jgi:hypothetical protein